MSVEILTMPQINDAQESLVSANNPSIFTVISDKNTQTDFLYVADVYVNDTKSVTLKTYPDPSFLYGIGVFDLNSIANKYVKPDFFGYGIDGGESLNPIGIAPNSSCRIQLKFYEQYVSGSTFINTGETTDTPIFNYIVSALSFTDDLGYNHDSLFNYAFANDITGHFLINPIIDYYPTQRDFRIANSNLRQYLYFFAYSGTNYVHIYTYDKNGTNLGHYSIANPYGDTTGVRYVIAGLPQLTALDPSTYTVFAGPSTIINEDVTSYAINFSFDTFDGGETPTPFRIVPECTKFSDTYSVYWLNTLGGFDSFRFARRNVTTISKNQSSAKRIQGNINVAGEFIRNSYDPSVLNYYTEYTTAIQLNSDWLSDFEVLLLQELFHSPSIYIEDQYGTIQAATIGDNSYPLNKMINGVKAYSLQLNLNLSASSYRQLL